MRKKFIDIVAASVKKRTRVLFTIQFIFKREKKEYLRVFCGRSCTSFLLPQEVDCCDDHHDDYYYRCSVELVGRRRSRYA